MPEITRKSPKRNAASARRRRLTTNQVEGYTPKTVYTAPSITPAPAQPASIPWPHGPLDDASLGAIAAAATRAWPDRYGTAHIARRIEPILGYLSDFGGDTWQQRWIASGLDGESAQPIRQTVGDFREAAVGLRTLFCLRVVRPSMLGFRATRFNAYAETFREAQRDPLLDRFFERVASHPDLTDLLRRSACIDVASALTIQAASLADLTPSALLHHGFESRRYGLQREHNRFAGLGAWRVLHEMGHFPASTPPTMRLALMRGQLTCAEMVDRYSLRNRSIRQLLIDYLERRRLETDYASVNNVATTLAGTFWAQIERINPEQADLAINESVYQQWRTWLNTLPNGKPRGEVDVPLITIRGFYLDLAGWALHEPERWAVWAAPCPVPNQEFRALSARRRRARERINDRTRIRQSMLPALLEHVDRHLETTTALLTTATHAAPGEQFEHGGRHWRRTNSYFDQRNSGTGVSAIRATDLSTGHTHNLNTEEDNAFWQWAAVTTLRHTGIRIEELVELTHLSIRQYRRANGEVIGLLVIAPSKTDIERVIPMSPEVFHVMAAVIRRLTADGRQIPLLRRYDRGERLLSEPMPFLFQRRLGANMNVIAQASVVTMLQRACERLAETNPAFVGVKFTPHDFRRLLATELVNSGLPIHIGAALLGHVNIQTTRGYVAVFDEQIVSHYQQFLAHRRALRPQEEYRDLTPQEWTDFEEHFDKRKVELGSCARPYGTPCKHEHACIRCPMLNINPSMLPRLIDIETDLLTRQVRAQQEGWLGELEGIALTLTLLEQKKREVQRLHPTSALLGMPTARTRTTP